MAEMVLNSLTAREQKMLTLEIETVKDQCQQKKKCFVLSGSFWISLEPFRA